MEYNFENETLTLFFKGQINSSNSEELEKEIAPLLENENLKSIRINMTDLEYISSAGLRIILAIKKQYEDTILLMVPSNVYDILVMVGFTNIMTIEQK